MNESGISLDSKTSMKEFLFATLEDNPRNERMVGLTEGDLVEVYEQSVEVIAFQEEVSQGRLAKLCL